MTDGNVEKNGMVIMTDGNFENNVMVIMTYGNVGIISW